MTLIQDLLTKWHEGEKKVKSHEWFPYFYFQETEISTLLKKKNPLYVGGELTFLIIYVVWQEAIVDHK